VSGSSSDPSGHAAGSSPSFEHRRWSVGRVLVLTVTGLCLYFLAPSIVTVLSAWRHLGRVEPWWIVMILVLESLSFVSIWALQRIAMPGVSWFDGATSQLVGNAFNRITPGGGATGTALQARLLADAGHDLTAMAAELAAQSLMISVTILAFPLFSLPAIIAGLDVPGSLADAAWIGGIVFAVVAAVGVVLLRTPHPLQVFGDALARFVNLFRRRRPPIRNLGDRLVAERATLRRTVGSHWVLAVGAAIGRWAFEYLVLLVTLVALGANVEPTLILLAFVTAELLGLLPFTPGGLGFVEAGLTGTLALAGVHAADAVLATLVFRLVSFWLPLPVGFGALVLFRRRHPYEPLTPDTPGPGQSGHTQPHDT